MSWASKAGATLAHKVVNGANACGLPVRPAVAGAPPCPVCAASEAVPEEVAA